MSRKKILHILTKEDHFPLDVITRMAQSHQITVVLTQDAINLYMPEMDADSFILSEDPNLPRQIVYPRIDYNTLLTMIFESDSVIAW